MLASLLAPISYHPLRFSQCWIRHVNVEFILATGRPPIQRIPIAPYAPYNSHIGLLQPTSPGHHLQPTYPRRPSRTDNESTGEWRLGVSGVQIAPGTPLSAMFFSKWSVSALGVLVVCRLPAPPLPCVRCNIRLVRTTEPSLLRLKSLL